MKTLKRAALLLLTAALIAPLAVQSIGCKGDVDGDGADLEIGDTDSM